MNNKSTYMPKYEGILFDCDGTLVDSEWWFSKLIGEKIREMGYPDFSDAQCRTFFKGHSYDYIRPWLLSNLKNFPIEAFELKLFPFVARELPIHLKEIDGAKKLLSSLVNYPKCIVSNGHLHIVNYSLELTGLRKFFKDNEMFTCELVKNPKPAPDLYLLACERMKLTPKNSIALEDSLAGVQSAVLAGVNTIGIIAHSEDEILAGQMISLGAKKVIYSLEEFNSIISHG